MNNKRQETPLSAAEEWRQRMMNWNASRAGKTTPVESRTFWDSVSDWEEYETHTNYPGAILDRIAASIHPESTILDVGAGTGSLSVPLAKIARSVTALEPSAAQVARLKIRLKKERSDNVRIIRQTLQEASLAELGIHEVAIASYSLFMQDIVPAIQKLVHGVSSRLFIVHLHSHDLQSVLNPIKGDDAQAPDATLLLRVLEEMGLSASTTIVDRAFSLPLELQIHILRCTQGLTSEQITILKKELRMRRQLFLKDGTPWLRRWYRDALLSIDPPNRRPSEKPGIG